MPNRLTILSTSHSLLFTFLAGCVATLGLPPLYFFPLTIVSLAFLYAQLTAATDWRRAALLAYLWHLGYFICGLYWIGFALLVDAAQFAWALPLAVLGLPLVLALFGAVLGAVFFIVRARLFLSRPRLAGIFFAVLWGAAEWLRGHAFTGFPWNGIGMVWAYSDISAQVAVIGPWAMAAFVTLLGVALFWYGQGQRRASMAVGILVLASLLFGWWRLPPDTVAAVDGVRLRLVQPNIAQSLKWDRAQAEKNLAQLIALSQLPPQSPAALPPTHVLWPETAVPFAINQDPRQRRALSRAVPDGGALITGAPWIERDEEGSITRLTNSLVALDAQGQITAQFDKFHLVPFGEYMPLPGWLGLRKITPGGTDFSPGPGPVTMQVAGLPDFSPLICYEIIFAGNVTDGSGRAGWILNVTNDGWYGQTAGPYQHLAMARLRAIETGLPVVRVANTGISAIFDGYGRLWASLPLGQAGVIDSALPRAISLF